MSTSVLEALPGKLDIMGQVLQIPVPRGKTVKGKFYRNVALRKLKEIYQIHRPKTGLEHIRLLHDNTPSYKARIVAEFLESEKIKVLPQTLTHQTLPLANISLFWDKNIIYLEGDIILETPSDLFTSISLTVKEYENCFKKWIDLLKQWFQVHGEYFEEQAKKNY